MTLVRVFKKAGYPSSLLLPLEPLAGGPQVCVLPCGTALSEC